jgi:hypothetical protein
MLNHQLSGAPLSGPHPVATDDLLPLVNTPPLPECEATVIIPARDEAERIGATLDALAGQVALDDHPLNPLSYEIIVLANNCDDATAGVSRRFAQEHPALALHVVELLLPPDLASVGTARRLLMDDAARRLLSNHRPSGVIISLDADTRPESTWLAATLGEIARGADAVGGRIVTDPAERATLPPGARLRHLRDVAHRMLLAELEALLDPVAHDPWPRHFQHFGASLAVTASAYRRAGGLPPVRAIEDVAFYLALRRAGGRVRHSPAVRVTTSARPTARSAIGFARQFATWAALHEAGVPQLVESAARVEARLHGRRRARALWRRLQQGHAPTPSKIASIAADLDVPRPWLAGRLDPALPFGALDADLERRQLEHEADARWSQEITAATRELRLLRDRLRRSPRRYSVAREDVEPVVIGALPAEVTQEIAGTIEEFLMHTVPGERVIGRRLGPVDQHQVPARRQPGDDPLAGEREVAL